ncbi:dehydrogenase [Streptomyces luteolifulvus]|uniref:Dehydrogenase n=1 Tax=Streptomyces luteolifulvus TaxID=2615112 RepID=A0A6H9USF2_9ACTN|nr:dehydrogenase [Streptomyces luteolifulvus]MXM68917.1 dehydrogenase [Streptomyces sp. HUCO-GS316]
MDAYTATFEPDGSLTVTTSKSTGKGTWTATGDTSFDFSVREDFNPDYTQISPTGKRAAYIQIDFSAQHDGEKFTGAGKAVIYAADDSLIYATDAGTEGRRVS